VSPYKKYVRAALCGLYVCIFVQLKVQQQQTIKTQNKYILVQIRQDRITLAKIYHKKRLGSG